MKTEELVKLWFSKWTAGEFLDLPLSDDFRHTSPFGIMEGKNTYLDIVMKNKDKFLGYHFHIRDAIYEKSKAVVRYYAVQGDFELEVSEWYYMENDLINEIVAYYHIGEIREDRQLASNT
ncbi:hypothetical protein PP178_05210 [Zeaxanthinibacter sp. PT1]|uniref:hypothetical protein n=1 Tax=Zeaxanthinibacter TaxID=561554 RepID=UPI00234BD402|nr:hypothetical protein [Zeaxanthinibacter sp. PT1]MDC6350941.1 hypothetical protein [Zeaxanthinibacter sp. PT1]